MDPLGFWRAADAEDRQGIAENKHVCGYLAYWDELRRRHPNMLIDSCASGGRRNDLETMRRAVPLWRSDYAFEPIGHQCMTYGISLWLPYHGTGTVASSGAPYYGGGLTAIEPYAFWSNAAPSLGSGIDVRVRQIDYDTLRRLYRQWRQLSRVLLRRFLSADALHAGQPRVDRLAVQRPGARGRGRPGVPAGRVRRRGVAPSASRPGCPRRPTRSPRWSSPARPVPPAAS